MGEYFYRSSFYWNKCSVLSRVFYYYPEIRRVKKILGGWVHMQFGFTVLNLDEILFLFFFLFPYCVVP